MFLKENQVGSNFSIEQYGELYKQISIAIKEQGADPGLTAKELIKQNILGSAVENFLIGESKKLGIKTPIKTSHLEEIFYKQDIFVPACGGTLESGFVNAGEIFPAYFSSNIKDWNLAQNQTKTEKTQLKVFKMTADGNFNKIFSSINTNKKKLCMTQAQIIAFVKKHKNKLRKDGYGTFFVFEENNEFFVAFVGFDDVGRLKLDVDHFDSTLVWFAIYQHHLVVPATALKN